LEDCTCKYECEEHVYQVGCAHIENVKTLRNSEGDVPLTIWSVMDQVKPAFGDDFTANQQKILESFSYGSMHQPYLESYKNALD